MMAHPSGLARASRRWLALGSSAVFILLGALIRQEVEAHWIPPEQIVSLLRNDPALRTHLGVQSVERQGRLLIIRVEPRVWNAAPSDKRQALATHWQRVWRHNVQQGIVAVVAAGTDQPLVNYDAAGQARLLDDAKGSENF